MPITTHIDKSKDLTVFTVKGILIFDEAVLVVKDLFSGDPTLHRLWDLLKVTDVKIASEQVEEIAALPLHYRGKGDQGKTAIVANETLVFGLSRMLETQAELKGLPYQIKVFHNADEAYQWLGEP